MGTEYKVYGKDIPYFTSYAKLKLYSDYIYFSTFT